MNDNEIFFEIPLEDLKAIHDLDNVSAGILIKLLFGYFEMTKKQPNAVCNELKRLFDRIVKYNEGADNGKS